ncbi:MAG: pyruvate kinase alpha/beta domain-containing protein [bacterium]|nr:pyruvate kinase alpha/beta domain-containing protein [bacterium]
MKREIIYFEDVNEDHTLETLKIAEKRMQEAGIKKIVIASTTGQTAAKVMQYFEGKDVTLVVVPHQNGFSSETNRFPQDVKEQLLQKGHHVHIATMLFHTDLVYSSSIPSIIADFLYTVGNGFKVCIEIVLMAADGGYTEPGEQVIAIAGTAKNADTALLMTAADTRHLRQLQVREILCKPYH